MKTQLELLADIIIDAVAAATFCSPEVLVTAGQPAAPSEEGVECQTVIYVYGDNMTDFNQADPDACDVVSRWAMQFQIWTCYPEDWEDQIGTDAAETAADCLYELMTLVWCAIVEAKDACTFGDCGFVELTPMDVQPRSGGAVSAIGGLTIPYDCTTSASPGSPSSP